MVVTIEDIQRVQEIRFQGRDANHYLLAPTSGDNELVALHVILHNSDVASVSFTIDDDAIELKGFQPNEIYTPINLYLPPSQLLERGVEAVDGAHPSENLFVPFLGGPVLLERGFSLIGWSVFEVPRGTKFKELRWKAGDVINIR